LSGKRSSLTIDQPKDTLNKGMQLLTECRSPLRLLSTPLSHYEGNVGPQVTTL